MIGSRLLFEGYGVSRKMRPYHAGLLGADTLVVLDEAHLVPPFEMLLDAIDTNQARVAPREEVRKVVPAFRLMSLSATGRQRATCPFGLTERDEQHEIVRKRLDAKKRVRFKLLQGAEDLSPAKRDDLLAKALAEEAWLLAGRGQNSVRVIVFCNKRKAAETAKKELETLAKKAEFKLDGRVELFVGGRRVFEREAAAWRFQSPPFISPSNPPRAKPPF